MMSTLITPLRGTVGILIACLVAISVFTVPHASAQTTAQTTAQLQQQINQLLAQITALQAQLAAIGSPASCTVTFTRSLGIGSSGADVHALQQFLNRDADTRLAVSGAGSPGFETQYYGPITANAVSRFQAKYRAEILTPLGLVNPTGYFGPSSIAKANALCKVVPPTTPPTTPPSTPDDEDELEGGEAILRNYEADDGDDTSLSEGQSNAPVMDVEFDVAGGDVRINRIDVALDHLTGGDDDPWDVFEEVSIWAGNEKIAEMDVDRRSVWSENSPSRGDYRLRMTGIDHIVREDDTAELTVALTVSGNVDDAGSVEWEVFIPENGIRVTDSLNLTHYTGDTNDTVGFTINEAGDDDDLVVRTSSDDPDASVLQLNRSSASNWLTVLGFTLDADDSASDIEIQSIPVTVEFSSETYDTLVRDARLVVDGEEYDDFTIENGNSDTATLTFDLDGDLVIDSGEEVDVELQLEFKALSEANEGITVQASISSAQADQIDAEGAEDLSASQISGSATGEIHVLRTTGATSGNISTTATVQESGGVERGVYTIKFDVTAFDTDLYVNRNAENGTTLGTAGVNYVVEESDGSVTTDGTTTAALSSNATVSGNRYIVREGQTRTFTLSVTYDPVTTDFYRVQLHSFNYNDSNADPDVMQRALPEQNFETDVVSIRG